MCAPRIYCEGHGEARLLRMRGGDPESSDDSVVVVRCVYCVCAWCCGDVSLLGEKRGTAQQAEAEREGSPLCPTTPNKVRPAAPRSWVRALSCLVVCLDADTVRTALVHQNTTQSLTTDFEGDSPAVISSCVAMHETPVEN